MIQQMEGKTMKAITVVPGEKNSLSLREILTPKALENEVLIKIIRVGIDGTDRDINEGFYGTAPTGSDFLIAAHEALGRILSLGENVSGFSENQLVVPTVRRACPENCINCRNGESDMCRTGNYFEHGIYKLHGFGSEYAVSNSNYLVKIPVELEEEAVLLEPLSIVEKAVSQTFKIQSRMNWKPENVLVLGAGPIGLLLTIILRLSGLDVNTVATTHRRSLKAEIVEETGGHYIDVSETPLKSINRKFDIIFEATGVPDLAVEAQDMIARNGLICYLGIYKEAKEIEDIGKIFTEMVLGNKTHFGSVNSNKIHFETGLKRMKEITIRFGNILERLITQRYALEDFKRAYTKTKEDIKPIIEF